MSRELGLKAFMVACVTVAQRSFDSMVVATS